ncbi:MAG: DeoR/GlpR family DNA-binding transcription regulator [Cyclobacteriaceae bacterium]|jgi:DeoR family fructose operon transcriptional repressor|nr:DeoR/GlpR family DNA-binding transcription regulator [Flammeovirgaceae bacterium]
MLREERHRYILNEVKIRNRVLLTDIAQQLAVSEDTVRRDLQQLNERGKLKKVHGGAVANSFHVYTYREDQIYAHEHKIEIATKAIQLLKDGGVLVMGGGTTNLEVARLLPEHLHLTVFTPSLPIAMQLIAHENIETIFVGGRLSHDAQIALGGETIKTFSHVKADYCFMGTGNLDATQGLTEFDWEVVQLKKAMIETAQQVVVLTISEKINSAQRFNVCPVTEIHVLVTELDLYDPRLTEFSAKGLNVL